MPAEKWGGGEEKKQITDLNQLPMHMFGAWENGSYFIRLRKVSVFFVLDTSFNRLCQIMHLHGPLSKSGENLLCMHSEGYTLEVDPLKQNGWDHQYCFYQMGMRICLKSWPFKAKWLGPSILLLPNGNENMPQKLTLYSKMAGTINITSTKW